jgi:Uma2 family endonuclease
LGLKSRPPDELPGINIGIALAFAMVVQMIYWAEPKTFYFWVDLMSHTAFRIGPDDNGRRMTLDDFDEAEVMGGYHVELGRGEVVVTEVPLPGHIAVVDRLRRQLILFDARTPGRIVCIASGGECKLSVAQFDSERHPDLAVYLTQPPNQDSNKVWSEWIPELVVEVVSPASEIRDYNEKRDEYLAFGVKEYWIVNPDRADILVLRRSRGEWIERIVTSTEKYQSRLFPDFELDVAAVFGNVA